MLNWWFNWFVIMRILKILLISYIFNLFILILCIFYISKLIRVSCNNILVMDWCGFYIFLRINYLYFNGIFRLWSIYSYRIKMVYYGKIIWLLWDVIYCIVNLYCFIFGFWNDFVELWFCLIIYKYFVIFYIFFNKVVSGV